MKYPREYLGFVERVIREYPQKVEELKRLEDTIVACCRVASFPTMCGKGSGKPEPERIVEAKEGNKHYQWLWRQVNRIRAGMRVLSKEEKELVQMMFFDDMRKWELVDLGYDEKAVWRMKVRVIRKVAPFVIGEWVKK
jgi:hypothetical protein